MDFLDAKLIEKIDDRLTEIVKAEYLESDCILFANITNINICYEFGGDPFVIITVKFGRYNSKDKDNDFEEIVELDYYSDNIEFIAGQFFQKIIDSGL